jgi:hypothetical protein
MVTCGYCRENVTPKMYLTWKGFISGLGIFYLIYIFAKIPQCPNCNFPMPRRNMVFALHLPERLKKSARRSALQMINFKDRVISASRRSYLNRKFDPFQYLGSMNTHQITSFNFNMITDKVHSFIGLDSFKLRK